MIIDLQIIIINHKKSYESIVATTPTVRGIFSGTISIFPILFPIITVLLAIILLMAVYTSRFYSQFIGFKGETYYTSLQQAFYTFVQLLTLDDWDANVLPVFESQQIIMPYILFPCFIIVSNVILLNILIAFANTLKKQIILLINKALMKLILIIYQLSQTKWLNYKYQPLFAIHLIQFRKATSHKEKDLSKYAIIIKQFMHY